MTQETGIPNLLLAGSQRILPGFESLRLEDTQLALGGRLGQEIGAVPVVALESNPGKEVTVYIRP